MSTSRLVHHAQVVWRSERIIAELRLKRLLGNLGLQALAALVLTFALLAFEIAAYFVLVQVWSVTEAAVGLGLCNLVIAVLLILIAARRPASREIALAKEVHHDALMALTAELEQAEAAAPASLRGALESAAIPLLLPLIPLVIRRLRKHTGESAVSEAKISREKPMNHPAFVPLRNTSLPRTFRYIRLERARDHDHPEGDSQTAYIMIAPLDAEARIDVDAWREHKEACRVVRKRPDSEDTLGHLVHGAGGSWRFHYDVSRTSPDESGYHFGGEKFETGEYLSIREPDGVNLYRVVSVLPL